VRVRARNPTTKKVIDGLEVATDPIQVISKPSVLRKKHEREKQKHQDLVATSTRVATTTTPAAAAAAAAVPASPVSAPASHKRTRDDVILESLSLISQQQAASHKLLLQLAANNTPSSSTSLSYIDTVGKAPALNFHASPVETDDDEFEASFRSFIRAFHSTHCEERAAKVRKVLREHPTEQMTPVLETLFSESFHKDVDNSVAALEGSAEPANWKLNSADWKHNSLGELYSSLKTSRPASANPSSSEEVSELLSNSTAAVVESMCH